MSQQTKCSHLGLIGDFKPEKQSCGDCLAMGDTWVNLRMCMICGKVGCCDDSKNKHAAGHFKEVSHPIIRSIQPGEDWMWCYVDEMGL